MKVLILDTLLKQASSAAEDHSKLTKGVISRIHKEYERLAFLEQQGTLALLAYINQQDGKPMLSVEGIYKYRLTDGDRIIYTRGAKLGYLAPEDKDSIVLLAYAKHDDQGNVAAGFNSEIEHDYVSVSQFSALAKELKIELDAGEFDAESQDFLYQYLLDPSSVQSHRILVVPDDEYLDLDPEMQDVALSETQSYVVHSFNINPIPTLVLGGAGTGKTVICMHVLNDFDNSVSGKTGIYFTQSYELLSKVEKKMGYLPQSKNTNDILRYDINDFLLEHINFSRAKIVKTRQFIQFINSRSDLLLACSSNGLEPITVWTEIRGTIKGSMGKDWIRTAPIKQTQFATSIEKLVKRNYFSRTAEDKTYITLADSISSIIKRSNEDLELTNADKNNIQKACQHFSTFDCSISNLSKNQYLNIDDEDTTIEKDKRIAVWAVFEAYSEWLKDNSLMDENDLVLEFLKNYSESLPECNLAVVDEVQDYTELQIYLLYRLAKASDGKIIFAGDINQNVNPTYFSEDHLRLLFTDDYGKSSLNIVHLTANFRCSREIVDVANRVSQIRKRVIASHSIKNEAIETAKKSGEKPYRLVFNKENVRQLLDTMMNYPRVALLVPDSATKDTLIEIIGRERYEKVSMTHFIFSVNEIKGMEYAYVVCYNLSSFYKDIWAKILMTKEAKKKTKYRFYFNLLYVAITRAEKYLCFMDDTIVDKLESSLHLDSVESFDPDALFFTSLPNNAEEQLKQARESFDSGHYEDALHIYTRLSQRDEIYQCKQRIAEENHDYEKALKYHMLIDPWNVYQFIREVPETSELKLVHDIIYVDPKLKRKSNISISEVVNKYYADDTEQLFAMQEMMFDRFKNDLYKGIDQLSKLSFYGGE